MPPNLSDVNRLERVLIAKRILFKKVVIMPKGNSPKIKGAICNVPIEAEDVCNILPRPACSNGLLVLKLKRKLMYHGHVYFEPIRPNIIAELLDYLKKKNPLYNNVTVDISQVSNELLCFDDEMNEEIKEQANISDSLPEIDTREASSSKVNEEIEEEENMLNSHRTASNETIMYPKIPMQIDEDILTVAPGEGKKPFAIYSDEKCEKMAFPHLFPTGKFGYQYEREIKLSPVKYFNQRYFT